MVMLKIIILEYKVGTMCGILTTQPYLNLISTTLVVGRYLPLLEEKRL
jgi:hypothetical protein